MKDLKKDNIKKLFFSYLMPSIGACVATSIYVLADTIMIGQYEGDLGLVALNIILPIFSMLMGVGLLFGVGGGVLYSYCQGRGETEKARSYFTIGFIFMEVISFILMAAVLVFFKPFMRLLGASELVMPLVEQYGYVIAWGLPLFSTAMFLQAFLRNDKNPKLAMIATITSGVINIVFDYLLVFTFNMGMIGAAIATVISYAINIMIVCLHFLGKNNGLKFTKKMVFKQSGEIAANGLPSFVIEIAGGIMIFILNRQIITYIGEYGVVVYGVISNVAIVALSLFNGVAQGSQPLIAVNFGANQPERVKSVLKLGLITTTIVGILLFILGEINPNFIVRLFSSNPDQNVLTLAPKAVRVYFSVFLLMNYNIFFSTFFQSCLRPKLAFVASILRGLVLGTLFAFILPLIFPFGIWLAIPLAEALTLIFSLCFFIPIYKKLKCKDSLTLSV